MRSVITTTDAGHPAHRGSAPGGRSPDSTGSYRRPRPWLHRRPLVSTVGLGIDREQYRFRRSRTPTISRNRPLRSYAAGYRPGSESCCASAQATSTRRAGSARHLAHHHAVVAMHVTPRPFGYVPDDPVVGGTGLQQFGHLRHQVTNAIDHHRRRHLHATAGDASAFGDMRSACCAGSRGARSTWVLTNWIAESSPRPMAASRSSCDLKLNRAASLSRSGLGTLEASDLASPGWPC